ncbi:MAG: TIGR02300 family protein [Opitutae bacterium]
MIVSKIKKGTKRICDNCSAKFYDLLKKPIFCPVCAKEYTHRDNNDFAVTHQPSGNFNKNESDKEIDDLSKEENIENNDEEIISLEEVEEENN